MFKNPRSMVLPGLVLTSYITTSAMPYPCRAQSATPVRTVLPASHASVAPPALPASTKDTEPPPAPASTTAITTTASQIGDSSNTATSTDTPLVKMTPKLDDSHPTSAAETPSAQPLSEQDTMKEGMKLTQEHNWDEAARLFQEVIGKDPNNVNAYYDLGAIAENKGDFKDAINWYEAAHGLSPNDRSIKDAIASVQKSQEAMAYGSLTSTPSVPAESMAPENPDLAGWKKMMKTEHHRQVRHKIVAALITAAIIALYVAAVCPK